MARPPVTDWATLDLVVDPTPGDADELERLAAAYAKLASNTAAGHELTSGGLTVADGSGTAMREFNGRLGVLPQRLAVAADSYATAATTLRRYASMLRDCQQRADAALRDGQHLHAVLEQQRVALGGGRAGDDMARAQRLADGVRAELATVRRRALDAEDDRIEALDVLVRVLSQVAELVDPPLVDRPLDDRPPAAIERVGAPQLI